MPITCILIIRPLILSVICQKGESYSLRQMLNLKCMKLFQKLKQSTLASRFKTLWKTTIVWTLNTYLKVKGTLKKHSFCPLCRGSNLLHHHHYWVVALHTENYKSFFKGLLTWVVFSCFWGHTIYRNDSSKKAEEPASMMGWTEPLLLANMEAAAPPPPPGSKGPRAGAR